MIRILCINDVFESKPNVDIKPQFMSEYESSGVVQCKCGCGGKGYIIPELTEKYCWEIDHFVELDEPQGEQVLEYGEVYAIR